MVEFEDWFRDKSHWLETTLIRGALLLLFILLISQALQTAAGFREVVNLVDRLEGQPYEAPEQTSLTMSETVLLDEHHLVLEILGNAEDIPVWVLVNGQRVESFDATGQVKIFVREGDVVEVDGELPASELEIVVSSTSDGIVSPVSGRSVRFYGLAETVGWVATLQNQ
jgi:hypothetical protein